MSDPQNVLILVTLAFVVVVSRAIICCNRSNPEALPYPPGPEQKLIVGNRNDLPSTAPWITYMRWGKQYGDLIHVRVFGHHTFIINSVRVAHDLFEKRSAIYSDRPVTPLLEMMGWQFNVASMPYGRSWRDHRTMFHQCFKPEVALAYRPTQTRKIHEFLVQLLDSPQEVLAHTRTLTAAIIVFTMYGHDIAPEDDRFVLIAGKAVDKLSQSVFPGAKAVNALPFLRHLPAWFPGAGFKRFAAECRLLTEEMQQVPFQSVKDKMAAGISSPSLAADLLAKNQSEGGGYEQEQIIKRVAATAYAAGSDTTASAIASSILAMLLYPSAVAKARVEIDRVIGKGRAQRLPDFGDRPEMVYVEAFYREVMRWRPATPLGVRHAASQDDVYEGFFIPKGATIIGNIWAMTHNEDVYPDPDTFKPERFITADGKLNDDDTILTYGFGRRICVGRHMADATMWLTIASVLALFDILPQDDTDPGALDQDRYKYTDGSVSHPQSFQCRIIPRSDSASRLVADLRN